MTRILIVEARFYPEISDALYEGAAAALGSEVATDRVTVPGALEIPCAIRLAAGRYDGFVALGCVIRGETHHFEIVANESARGLMDLMVRDGLCIGNGILTVENEEQAMHRARPNEFDKGGDAARACLALIALKRRFASK
jgi:6,7-dimethyl-8-ribityllumazine synthase